MATLKDIAENAKVAAEVAQCARKWASRSTPKVLLLLSLVGVLVLVSQALYFNHLSQQSTDASKQYVEATTLLSDELRYETAIDAISSCLKSRGGDETLHKWYCSQADDQFKLNTEQLKYPGAQEIFQLRAYLAMKDLMRSRLRGLALYRLEPPTDISQSKAISLVASKAGAVLVGILTALLMLCTYAFLRWPRE